MKNYSIHQQHGAALIVSMIILVAMTLLGVTSMKGSSTELIMAGNLRESALTFQAAEAGLSAAETVLQTGTDPDNLLLEAEADPDYLSNLTWEGDNVTKTQLTLANITTSPRYITKYLGEWNPDLDVDKSNPGFSGYGHVSNARRVAYFRITARGFGQSGKTFRTVQSFYGRMQPNN